MSFSTLKSIGLVIIGIMFVLFSVLGFCAMRPGSSQKLVTAFWATIGAFLIFLSVYLFFFFSPVFAIAPLLPLFLFARMFLAIRRSQNK